MKGKHLAIVLIILLISFNATGSIIRNSETKNISTISYDKNILYVGGNGPNNYTKIHDAINDTIEGDTVFVYNGTYYEHNITINNSINLIGENRDDTIISGFNISEIIIVDSDWFNISGFTITKGDKGIKSYSNNMFISDNNLTLNYESGIYIIRKDNNNNSGTIIINNNVFSNNFWDGISANGYNHYTVYNISENIFINNSYGIHVGEILNSLFSNNVMINNKYIGFSFASGSNCTISNNHISGSMYGSYFLITYNYTIILNNFFNNDLGMWMLGRGNNKIIQNNFIDNNISAKFHRQLFGEWFFLKLLFSELYNDETEPNIFLLKNTWDNNFWDEDRLLPYPILGVLFAYIPWVTFDWNPASEPYDI